VCANSLHERIIEVQQVLPELDVREDDNLLLDGLVTNDWVVDTDTSKVEVLGVIGLDEAVRDVWNIEPGVRLAGDVRLPVVESKEINEALVEATELSSKFDFIGDVRCSLSELRNVNGDLAARNANVLPRQLAAQSKACWSLTFVNNN
jgi:hypothetical protein